MSARPLSDDEYTKIVEFLSAAGRKRDRLLLVARRNLKGGAGVHCRSVRSRRVPLSAKIQETVAEYVASLPVPVPAEAALFRTSRSAEAAMNRSSAFRMLAQADRECGIDSGRVTTHTLRKTFVARAYRASGCDLIKTQRIVGHRSPMTTARYLETDQSELDELVRTLAA